MRTITIFIWFSLLQSSTIVKTICTEKNPVTTTNKYIEKLQQQRGICERVGIQCMVLWTGLFFYAHQKSVASQHNDIVISAWNNKIAFTTTYCAPCTSTMSAGVRVSCVCASQRCPLFSLIQFMHFEFFAFGYFIGFHFILK